MKIFRDKLYQGKYVDLRSYEIEEAIKRDEKIVVYCEGKKMTLSPEDLKRKKILLNKDPVISKVNLNQEYYLYSYLWQPDKEVDVNSEEYIRELAQSGIFG